MLLKGNTETIPIPKMFAMLEFASRNDLEKLPSPRVLNSHFPLCILPRQIKGMNLQMSLCCDKITIFGMRACVRVLVCFLA